MSDGGAGRPPWSRPGRPQGEVSGADRTGRPRIVVVEHFARAHLGVLTEPLSAGADLLVLRGYVDPAGVRRMVDELLEHGAYDGLIVLGGPMGVYEREAHPFLNDSLRLIADALARDLPVLALCLGSQLLAHVLGSPPFRGLELDLPRELGFVPLILEPGAEEDPVAALFAPPQPVLEWHADTYELPPGTVRLAGSDLYATQIFRLNPGVYGLQFHPEVDAAMLDVWVRESGPQMVQEGHDPSGLPARARELDEVIRRRAHRLAELFLGWVGKG